MKLLVIKNIKKNYHTDEFEIAAIQDVSFEVSEGDFIAIVGPSGSGKTTILSLISGLEKLSEGEIVKYKDNLRFGYMFQTDTLFPWLTIIDNCLLGPKVNGKVNKKTKKRCVELLKGYNLDKFINNYPNSLSGGMKQRVVCM